MATLALGIAGAAIGAAVLPAGVTVLGTAISGAAIGGMIGSTVGSFIDQQLFAPDMSTSQQGPRLKEINLLESTEGAPIPRIYGRQRVSGQVIWATRFKETIVKHTQTAGGGKGGAPSQTVTTTEYLYSCSFAVAICEGEIHRIERIWADGNIFDLSGGGETDSEPIKYRIYRGTEDQPVDPLMEAKEGSGNNPAYRGIAYIVFEDLPLKQFSNRIPQLQFEVIRNLGADYPDSMENLVKGVCLIPGAGEFVYATQKVTHTSASSETSADNKTTIEPRVDVTVSLDQLNVMLPACDTVAVVVGWFGTDLRCNQCQIRPGVELRKKDTKPLSWAVAGYNRSTAHLVSATGGRANYGGTPSDNSVRQLIRHLKSRGYKVLLYPFVFMDIPEGNSLPNPYSDNASSTGQPVHPWRGRITLSVAPGFAGSPDKTSTAATQVNAFFDNEYSPFILHYADMAADENVDAFLIGSELVGLTTIRSSAGDGTYPAVEKLRSLASSVKSIVGSSCKVGYAANWDEYHSHRPTDGSGDVIFNMDRLWSHSAIDFIGIDNYLPISDWRDGEDHLDFQPNRRIYDKDYLQSGINGGEYFDWYYASELDRKNQSRTPITDGAYNKPWVYRNKDLWSWWSNPHYSRPGGVENRSPTGWTPQSKPIWFTELGCPAIDKGSNQPNVFYDPRSSESAVPYFSHGWRDDQIQRAFIEAHMEFWSDPNNNPASGVYAGRMVDTNNIFIWCWDARPFPYFPKTAGKWSDADNWNYGHWLNGRAGLVSVAHVIKDLMARQNFTDYDVSEVHGLVSGYKIDQPMTARAAIEPLGGLFFFDGVESDGKIVFRHRDRPSVYEIADDDLVVMDASEGNNSPFELTRGQESELPRSVRITYIDSAADYRQATVPSRRLTTTSKNDVTMSAPMVLEQAEAAGIAEMTLIEAWVKREGAKFILPPTALAVEPGDVIDAILAGKRWRLRLESLSDAHIREAEARRTDRSVYKMHPGPVRSYSGAPTSSDGTPTPIISSPTTVPNVFGPSALVLMDLPLITGEEDPGAPHVAAFAKPWTSQLLYRSPTGNGYTLNTTILAPATMGVLLDPLYPGVLHRWDRANKFRVELFGDDQLLSTDDISVFGGANVLFVENEDGGWEVLQFANAELVSPRTYELSKLLRGQLGTELEMRNPVAEGARVVLLDSSSAQQVSLSSDNLNLDFYWRWGPSVYDISNENYQEVVKSFKGVGYRPYSPSHVRGSKDGNDIVITWLRRTRIDGDRWDLPDVPLSETEERYEIDIMDGDTVVRTLSSTTQSVTYTEAMQTADWGSAVSGSLTVKVYQLSSVFGRGAPRTAVLNV